jgi:VIT1/CCC1 family predicted Fe2+/Mn2+ transporter
MKTQTSGIFILHQQRELNASALYKRISKKTRSERESETLLSISNDEQRHAQIFEKYTGRTLKPNLFWVRLRMLAYYLFGYTFLIKLLERAEDKDIDAYAAEIDKIPELREVLDDEERHEKILVDILDEERLHYVSNIVLGMNDALVELTGALAGYTLAMQHTRLIAMAGLITGVSATLSMAASGYLSSREEENKNAVKSSVYTGFAYLITVALLIAPYLLFPVNGYVWALAVTLLTAVLIIAGFNYYLSVAKERPFRKSFFVMAAISLGVACISFIVGIVVKNALGIDL